MSDVRLGEIPEVDHRDAIHVAIIPMTAGAILAPGQRVGVVNGYANSYENEETLGVVDPFRTDYIPKGERFWLCLLPDSVTGMRHQWECPAFDSVERGEELNRATAEAWLRSQCEPLGVTFERLTEPSELTSDEWIISSENESGRDHWYEIQDEFWKYRAAYTGADVPEEDRGGFTCSC